MADRFRRLGARAVEVLPNGAPTVDSSLAPAAGAADIVYVGNIQPRLRVDLLLAAADAAAEAGVRVRIIGAIQALPLDWERLLRHRAVRYEGPQYGPGLLEVARRARIGIIPHVVDEYTTTQDAMKAWDYLAWGLQIVSTSVPPVSHLPSIGIVADDPNAFGAAVASALGSGAATTFERQRELARENSWALRAVRLRSLIE
jgi:glycosyltransferase involved in cell wall biosynthesis